MFFPYLFYTVLLSEAFYDVTPLLLKHPAVFNKEMTPPSPAVYSNMLCRVERAEKGTCFKKTA